MNSRRTYHSKNTSTDLSIDGLVHKQISQAFMGLSPISLALAYGDWLSHLAISPGKQAELAQLAVSLQQKNLSPDNACTDSRFNSSSWQQWPFNIYKNNYQALESWWNASTQVNGTNKHHNEIVKFFTRQSLDAMSPSNWPWTNPDILNDWQQSNGQSLINGMHHLLQDSQHTSSATNADLPELSHQVGKDVAITPGKVVYKNHLIELIQYEPTTAKVIREPLLIVPSCIMKYYILDLSPKNSMVKYLVDQGITVFMVSWRNPDSNDRNLGMDDYIQLGILDAIQHIQQATKTELIHAMGYCLGGTFLSIAAAYLGRDQQVSPLKSVTLLAAQTDFSEPGELGVFIDDDQLLTLQEEMAEKGYLSGRQMASSFQFLNSRDLVWSRNTQRYWLGQDEIGNDMMSWNKDTTRLPARMHTEYLNSLFLNDAITEGHYRALGEVISLRDIHAPLFVVGTSRDHISPWKSVYKIHLTVDAPITFTLASGGHNAGIVSEPGHPNRSYQLLRQEDQYAWIDQDEWQAKAPFYQGSWWQAWSDWLVQHSSGQCRSRVMTKTYLSDAPGHYVKVRYAD